MAQIIGLNGAPVVVEHGQIPVAAIVQRLEELTAQAKRGDILAMAVALVRPGYTTSTMYETGDAPCSHQLMAAIAYLHHRYAERRVEQSEEVE